MTACRTSTFGAESTEARLIRLTTVLQIIPVSKSTWWEGVRSKKYPQPVKLGRRITCWRLMEILKLAELGSDGTEILKCSSVRSHLSK